MEYGLVTINSQISLCRELVENLGQSWYARAKLGPSILTEATENRMGQNYCNPVKENEGRKSNAIGLNRVLSNCAAR